MTLTVLMMDVAMTAEEAPAECVNRWSRRALCFIHFSGCVPTLPNKAEAASKGPDLTDDRVLPTSRWPMGREPLCSGGVKLHGDAV
jgi:hypothetical protein